MIKPSSKVDWLLQYVSKLSSEYQGVVEKESQDFSQDKIKLVFHEQRFRNFLTGKEDKIVPITFEVWPSLTCNARCPLCTYALNNARLEADRSENLFVADVSTYKRIFESFRQAGVHSLIITGGGEPTLHPQVADLLSHAYRLGFAWGMFTHGLNLTEKLIHDFLACEPRFIRVSVNAGSARSHELEYRVGKGSYAQVAQNVTLAAKISHQYNRVIGLGYALNGRLKDAELDGIVDFVSQIMESSQGGLRSVAFRPKVVYYTKQGHVASTQPGVQNLTTLSQKINDKIVTVLQKRFGDSLHIDHKQAMFNRLAQGETSRPAIGNAWTSQIDHQGKGYILSELNGSPWENSCYGQFTGDNFNEVWASHTRLHLSNLYNSGKLRPPVHHKISHVDDFLNDIREAIGILTKQEADEFYTGVETLGLQRPKNWDFL